MQGKESEYKPMNNATGFEFNARYEGKINYRIVTINGAEIDGIQKIV
jgi:hypothetical protein